MRQAEHWRSQSEVIDWTTLVETIRPTPDSEVGSEGWWDAWDNAEDLGLDMELLDWCEDVVSRSANQYRPIVVRDGVVTEGLEQALAWFKYGAPSGRKRIHVQEEAHDGR